MAAPRDSWRRCVTDGGAAAFDATVVNMVVSGELGVGELAVEDLAADIGAARVSTAPGRAYINRADESATVMVFRSGAVTVAGATTREEVGHEITWFAEAARDLGVGADPTRVAESMTVKYVVVRADLDAALNLPAVSVALGMENTEYEPEQFPATIYRPSNAECTVLLFSSGRVLVTGVQDETEAARVLDAVYTDLQDAALV